MQRKLLALLLVFVLLPAAAAPALSGPAAPASALPGSAVVAPLPDTSLRFWDTSGAQAWEARDLELFPNADDVLTVIAAELGAADCFILRCGGQTALIDCGWLGPGDLVLRLLAQEGIDRFDFVINTHPHDDHINGIFELLPKFPIGKLYVGFDRYYRNLNKRLFREAEKLGIPVEQVETPKTLTLGSAELTLYQVPWGDNTNNRSLVTRLTLGERSILLPADIGQSGMLWLLDTYGAQAFQADILKAPHHGIDLVPPELLAAAGPQAIFITYVPHSRNEETVKKLRMLGYEPLFAGLGSLVMKTDGNLWTITQLPREGR